MTIRVNADIKGFMVEIFGVRLSPFEAKQLAQTMLECADLVEDQSGHKGVSHP